MHGSRNTIGRSYKIETFDIQKTVIAAILISFKIDNIGAEELQKKLSALTKRQPRKSKLNAFKQKPR